MKRLAAAPPPTEVLASRIDAIVRFDRRARLGEIRCPTLVVVAGDDALTPAFYSEELAAEDPRRQARGAPHRRPLRAGAGPRGIQRGGGRLPARPAPLVTAIRPIRLVSAVLLLAVLVAPLAADAQGTGKIVRIGRLSPLSAETDAPYIDAFRKGLRELGWVEGKTFTIEGRFADGKSERLPELATELVRQRRGRDPHRLGPGRARGQESDRHHPHRHGHHGGSGRRRNRRRASRGRAATSPG